MSSAFVEPDDPTRPWGIAAALAVLTFVLCYLRNFVLFHTPVMLWGDQLLYATNGARMISGQMPYRDFFELMPAGTDLVYTVLFHLFGIRLWIPNLLMDCLAGVVVLLTTLAAGSILRSRFVWAPGLLALGLGLFGGLDATHHWFSTVATLAALVVLLRGIALPRVAVGGLLCGIAASFTQSKGALVTAGFLIYVVWRSRRSGVPRSTAWRGCAVLCATALASFLAINGYYMQQLGLREWWRWVVLFPLRFYSTTPGQDWRSPLVDLGSHPGLLKWVVVIYLYLVVPLVYAVLLLSPKLKRAPPQVSDRLILITIIGLAMFLGIVPSLSMMRASAVCFPATILLAWLIAQSSGWYRLFGQTTVALSLAIALLLAIRQQESHWYYLDLSAGRTAISDRYKYDLYLWMAEHTHSGDPYLGIAAMSLPLGLQTPGPIQAPGPWEYYRPEHVDRSIAAMETYRIPLLVLSPLSFYEAFPKERGYGENHFFAYDQYIRQHYHRLKQFSNAAEVWQRNDRSER
ncbi:hypothetical protein [Granulicella arctica]|uniref:hypothetical protein n=1 Tax=Granulicella arctica TaxID=940613 RepID=UPI0021E0E0EC|nr:hypothetical protein [Granulicella arctica]